MKGNDTKHVAAFRASKLKPTEEIHGHLEGWIGEMMGKGKTKQHNGQFFLTSERVCFYRKGVFGEVLETIPLAKITSVETLSMMGYRVIRLHTSHDELAFKTFESKEFFEAVYEKLELIRHGPSSRDQSMPIGESVADQIRKLSELKDAGILTEEEFSAKKAELLQRI